MMEAMADAIAMTFGLSAPPLAFDAAVDPVATEAGTDFFCPLWLSLSRYISGFEHWRNNQQGITAIVHPIDSVCDVRSSFRIPHATSWDLISPHPYRSFSKYRALK